MRRQRAPHPLPAPRRPYKPPRPAPRPVASPDARAGGVSGAAGVCAWGLKQPHAPPSWPARWGDVVRVGGLGGLGGCYSRGVWGIWAVNPYFCTFYPFFSRRRECKHPPNPPRTPQELGTRPFCHHPPWALFVRPIDRQFEIADARIFGCSQPLTEFFTRNTVGIPLTRDG